MFNPVFEFTNDKRPDSLDSLTDHIPAGFIISKDNDGNTLSRYEDDAWDLRPYGAEYKFSFDSWHKGKQDDLSSEICNELKTITWFLLYTPAAYTRSVKSSTIGIYLQAMSGVAKIAYRLGIPLKSTHNSPRFLVGLKSSIASSVGDVSFANNISRILGLLLNKFHFLNNLNETRNAFIWKIVPEDELDIFLALLQKQSAISSTKTKQTPLIPSRIFRNLIVNTEKKINSVEKHLNGIEAFLTALYTKPYIYCDNSDQYKANFRRISRIGLTVERNIAFDNHRMVGREETITMFGLKEFLDDYGIEAQIPSIKRVLSQIQLYCATLVLSYSGMRLSELSIMPFDCYKEIEIKDYGKISYVQSHTKKLVKSNYSKKLLWVTSVHAGYAISIAQRIAKIFWTLTSPSPFPKNTAGMPLWLSSSPSIGGGNFHYDYNITKLFGGGGSRAIELFEPIDGLVIEQSDIDELIVFDTFRNWDEDELFSIGKSWPIASHQFRRSVAVYASRSGMVSLPSIGTQFKHLTIAMTALYAENASFAQSFILEDGKVPASHQVMTDYRTATEFNAAINFHEQVINAESKLIGGRGTAIQIHKNKGNLPMIMDSPQATAKAIRQGRMSYTETIVGGCMRKEVCDSYGVDEIVPCVFNCSDSIIGGDNGEKIMVYMNGLELGLEEMDEDSLSYKATKQEIEKLQNLINGNGV